MYEKRWWSVLLVICMVIGIFPKMVLQTSASGMPPMTSGTVTGGTFYIKNADTNTFMQVDDGEAPNYTDSGAFMELWDYTGDDYQRWRINRISQRYYQIICEKSGLALSVQEDYLNKSGKKLVQEPYAGEARQQWTITLTSRGTYVIRPRSGESYSKDWCMSGGASLFGFSNGLNVEQRE